MERIDLSFLAPIPVGHKVELTTYRKIIDGRRMLYESWADLPVIRDLDTGIEYTSVLLELELGKEESWLEVEQTFVGRVTACRVITQERIKSATNAFELEKGTRLHTTLTIEPDLESGPYR